MSGEGPPVDLRVTLGSEEFALEHTRILPFDDRIEVAKAYQDISACLAEWFRGQLPGDAFYELYLPLGVPRPGRGGGGERRRRGLSDWIGRAVDVLQARAPGWRRLSPYWYELGVHRREIKRALNRFSALFYLYLAAIGMAFVASLVEGSLPCGVHRWIEHVALSVGAGALALSFGLPMAIRREQLRRLDEGVENRKKS